METLETCDDIINVSSCLSLSESEDNFNYAIVVPSKKKTFLGLEAKQVILNVFYGRQIACLIFFYFIKWNVF